MNLSKIVINIILSIQFAYDREGLVLPLYFFPRNTEDHWKTPLYVTGTYSFNYKEGRLL